MPAPARGRDERVRARVEDHEGGEGGAVQHQHHDGAPDEPLQARQVDGRDHDRHQRQHEQPQQERALLARPETGDAVEDGEARVGVLEDVGEAEVGLQERLQQDDRGDQRGEREGVGRVVAVADEVAPPGLHAVGDEDGGGEREHQAEVERETSEEQHRGPYGAVSAAMGVVPLPSYFDGHFVCSSSAVISPPAAPDCRYRPRRRRRRGRTCSASDRRSRPSPYRPAPLRS
jgi:hypothetical protein